MRDRFISTPCRGFGCPARAHCIIAAAMWSFFHKLGSPPWLYAISGAILRWLLPITLIALAVGLVWGLLFTPRIFARAIATALFIFMCRQRWSLWRGIM